MRLQVCLNLLLLFLFNTPGQTQIVDSSVNMDYPFTMRTQPIDEIRWLNVSLREFEKDGQTTRRCLLVVMVPSNEMATTLLDIAGVEKLVGIIEQFVRLGQDRMTVETEHVDAVATVNNEFLYTSIYSPGGASPYELHITIPDKLTGVREDFSAQRAIRLGKALRQCLELMKI